MISTRHLDRMPDIPGFRRLTRALATLDAILSPEWELRYYAFNSTWAEGQMMASMRDGSGDEWWALLYAISNRDQPTPPTMKKQPPRIGRAATSAACRERAATPC